MGFSTWNTNLKIRLVAEGIFGLMFWMFFPFMSMYFADTLGKGMAGALLVGSQLIAVVTGLFGGYLADTYGRRRMMLIAGWGQAIAIGLFATASSPWLESPILSFAAFSMLGAMGSLYWPASSSMVADVAKDSERNTIFATFYTITNICVVIGPLLGGIFFFQYRFELLIVCTIVCLGVVLTFQRYLKETLQERIKPIAGTNVVLQQVKNYGIVFQDKIFLLFIIAGILSAQTFTQMNLLLGVYIHDMFSTQSILGWDMSNAQLFSGVVAENGLLVALLTIPLTKIVNRQKARNVFVMSSLLYGCSMIIFGHSTVWIGLLIGMFVFTLGEVMVVGLQNSFIADIAPDHMRGQYFAAASLRFSIGKTLAPLAIPLSSFIGFTATFYAIAFITFISAGIYYITFNMVDKKKRQKAA